MIKLYIVPALFTIFSSAVQACTCSVSPPTTNSLRSANEVFIFRLLDAKLAAKKPHGANQEIVGNIKIVERLRGTSGRLSQIRFFTGKCCGTRLDVGAYFL